MHIHEKLVIGGFRIIPSREASTVVSKEVVLKCYLNHEYDCCDDAKI
jgi:hypothetical protein